MNSIVGYTGFVGSNIYENGEFDCAYNSKNIDKAFGTNPDLLVYAGLRAEKYLANCNPTADMAQIQQAESNIAKIHPKKLVLISTIDVFKTPVNVDENSPVDLDGLQAYGLNRYSLECWVRENYPDALIVRLPGLFGKNIKKNFIYDFIHVIPYMLKPEKCDELGVKAYYDLQPTGFYRVKSDVPKEDLKSVFIASGFTAMNFTDSRSVYQFYPLKRLWSDIQTALKNGILLQHMATEPVSVSELHMFLTGNRFVNELQGCPAFYDYHTVNVSSYGGNGFYLLSKYDVMSSIKEFVNTEKNSRNVSY